MSKGCFGGSNGGPGFVNFLSTGQSARTDLVPICDRRVRTLLFHGICLQLILRQEQEEF